MADPASQNLLPCHNPVPRDSQSHPELPTTFRSPPSPPPPPFTHPPSIQNPRKLVSQIPLSIESELSKSPTPPKPKRLNSDLSSLDHFWHYWKWETASGFLVLATPFIIVATIYPHAGDPLPEWPFRISINTLLSIYTVVFKACIAFIIASCIGQLQWIWFSSARPLYDLVRYSNAGNGPWGSLQLLWAQHIKQPLTAFGALILIASVLVDPFTQQLISPISCSMHLPTQTATLPRTNIWHGEFLSPDVRPVLNTTLDSVVYDPGKFMSWKCATGNCNFTEPYGTVAYCSSCEDVSMKLVFDQTCKPNNNGSASQSFGICPDNGALTLSSGLATQFAGVTGWANMTFNHTNKIMLTAGVQEIDYRLANDEWGIRPGVKSIIVAGKTTASVQKSNLTAGQLLSDCDNIDTWRCRGYGAAICTLMPCVRLYQGSIINGELTERLVSTSGSLPWGGDTSPPIHPRGMLDTNCTSPEDNSRLQKLGYNVSNTSSQWLPVGSQSFSRDQSLRSSLIYRNCLYEMGQLETSIEPTLKSSLEADIYAGSIQGMLNPSMTFYGHFRGPQLFQEILNNGNMDFERIDSTYSNISNSLTAWMRTHSSDGPSDGPRQDAIGEVLQLATCIHVRWWWFAYPAALSFSTLVLLTLVVINTARQKTPVWKASPLAWIMRGPGGYGTDESLQGTTEAMEQCSKSITVSLLKGSDPLIQMVDDKNEEKRRH
ncbi:uncharacterized protein BP5553_06572 [Venustampulla echinocandica]|uniref:Uncharacterized protein n=1 Tax=Venustampulla echinocandica TaxID=2656787 RepID=A0A370TKA9_9HELO|nr:uncharacterized protein BP5553_06572 [Venustampulla echinocandica]RDL35960.1 hypothetical protein BP5553_06572 [Venustampulla echinocandica]